MSSDNIAQDAADAERRTKAIRLRVRGAHWNEIAERCGYPSAAAALRDVGEAMAAATQRAEETADQMRNTAQLRLESLLSDTLDMLDADAPFVYDEHGNSFQPDDRAVKLRAVDEARRLVESIAKLNKLDKTDDQGKADVPTIRIVGIDPSDLL